MFWKKRECPTPSASEQMEIAKQQARSDDISLSPVRVTVRMTESVIKTKSLESYANVILSHNGSVAVNGCGHLIRVVRFHPIPFLTRIGVRMARRPIFRREGNMPE